MSATPSAENDAPVRPCCSQRHRGPICPDGLVMCCICFSRVPKERLALVEDGDGSTTESAPIYEDVCRTCRQREKRWGGALSDPSTYIVKEVPTWHGEQDTPRSATTVATSAPTSADVPPSTQASTCATVTHLGDEDAGPVRSRVIPPATTDGAA